MVAKRKVETSFGIRLPETRIPNMLPIGWPFRESLPAYRLRLWTTHS
jgi:hypothetical protein